MKKIKVRAVIDVDGQLDFEVDGVKAKQAKLKLDKGSGAHDLNFDLQDHSGRGLQFDTGDPIWVDEDGPCPPSPGISSDQLSVTGCTTDRLSAVDANNGRSRELRYQLNFIAADGSHSNCDPIIQNGGGGGSE